MNNYIYGKANNDLSAGDLIYTLPNGSCSKWPPIGEGEIVQVVGYAISDSSAHMVALDTSGDIGSPILPPGVPVESRCSYCGVLLSVGTHCKSCGAPI